MSGDVLERLYTAAAHHISESDPVMVEARRLLPRAFPVLGPAVAEVAEARARAVVVRTALWLRALVFVLQSASGRLRLSPHVMASVAAAGGFVARTLLEHRASKAEPEDVVNVTLLLGQAVWLALGVFVRVSPQAFAALVETELVNARSKFPRNTLQLAAMSEEVGEFADAFRLVEGGMPVPDTLHDLTEEAVQAVAMACRVATEGDSTFPYDPAGVSSWVLTGLQGDVS